MKKIVLIAFVLVVFISCSSDDNSVGSNNNLIVGTWTGVSSIWNGNDLGVPDSNIVIFTSNNRTEFIYQGFGNNGEDISEFGSWTKVQNIITITWDESDIGEETTIFQIEELTESNLRWLENVEGEGTLIETYQK